MSTLQEIHQKTTRSPEFDKMIRSVDPLFNCFGMNHFYFVRTLPSGHCAMLGTHCKLNEYLFDNISLMKNCKVLRHPNHLLQGVTIPKYTADPVYKAFLDNYWNRFHVNITINLQRKIGEGTVVCGFGVKYNHPNAEQFLLNELPLLNRFVDYFCETNKKIIQLAYDYQVDMRSLLGSQFDTSNQDYPFCGKKEPLLRQLGLDFALTLTKREIDVILYVAQGYPASYVARELHLSVRTVENYIAIIKSKLNCSSKVTLIKKARAIAPFYSEIFQG